MALGLRAAIQTYGGLIFVKFGATIKVEGKSVTKRMPILRIPRHSSIAEPDSSNSFLDS
ncbi:hypothetical protein GYMLUDRAFT_39837 [Collybiopsis luxurians FD-317 M1]|nr:hypothetical protein GYMLUDRAFT_39837 [Collybiopsis luxurians FD-317 M1]